MVGELVLPAFLISFYETGIIFPSSNNLSLIFMPRLLKTSSVENSETTETAFFTEGGDRLEGL